MCQIPAARALGRAVRELAGLLLPADCAVCGGTDGTVCPDCALELAASLMRPFRAEQEAAALPLVCHGRDEVTEEDIDAGPVPLPVVAAGRYGGPLARALLAFKDHGRTPVGRHLRPAVYRVLAAAPELLGERRGHPLSRLQADHPGRRAGTQGAAPVLLVPVPGSASGFRRRGYDPVAELLGGPLPPGWRLAPGLLRHASHRGAPGGLSGTGGLGLPGSGASHAGAASSARRHRNAGRFRAAGRATRLQDRTVVLFDDVMTTGATLAAAWRALDRAGLEPVGAVVLTAVTAPGATPAEGLNSGWRTY